MSERRGEGLRKRETRSSKLEERREREMRARLSRFRISRSGRGGLASRDAYQNDEGVPSRRW